VRLDDLVAHVVELGPVAFDRIHAAPGPREIRVRLLTIARFRDGIAGAPGWLIIRSAVLVHRSSARLAAGIRSEPEIGALRSCLEAQAALHHAARLAEDVGRLLHDPLESTFVLLVSCRLPLQLLPLEQLPRAFHLRRVPRVPRVCRWRSDLLN